jgi:hypothetical protein
VEFGPEFVEKAFNCGNNKLTSFQFGPKRVNGTYHCYRNQINSFKHLAEYIGGQLDCFSNPILSLSDFNCSIGENITHSEFIIEELKDFYNDKGYLDIPGSVINTVILNNKLPETTQAIKKHKI